MDIGVVIKKYRKEAGMTQEEMANRLGVTTPAVNKWENSNSKPDIELLAPIARLLDISLDTLLSFHENLSDTEIEEIISENFKAFLAHDFGDGLFLLTGGFDIAVKDDGHHVPAAVNLGGFRLHGPRRVRDGPCHARLGISISNVFVIYINLSQYFGYFFVLVI